MSTIGKDQLEQLADNLFDTYKPLVEAYCDVLNTGIIPDEGTVAEIERQLKDKCDVVECKDCGLWVEMVQAEDAGNVQMKVMEEHSCPKTVSTESTCNTITNDLQPATTPSDRPN